VSKTIRKATQFTFDSAVTSISRKSTSSTSRRRRRPHRAAATALTDVIHQQQRPWDLRLLCIQDLLDSIDFVRKSVGIPFQDVYNIMLRHGWTLGTKQMVPVMHLLIRMSHRQQVQVLTRHWAAHRPDMVVSLIPHYNRACARRSTTRGRARRS
jgi:hypothetical protein